jgi:hypothetical protein
MMAAATHTDQSGGIGAKIAVRGFCKSQSPASGQHFRNVRFKIVFQ